MNNFTTVARLGKDPKSITTREGKLKAWVNIALNGYKEIPDWMPIIAWEKSAEILMKAVKGQMVGVTGRLEKENWEGDNGPVERWVCVASRIDLLALPSSTQTSGADEPKDEDMEF